MGLDTKKPPLPAPTESLSDQNPTEYYNDDVATDLSRRTDATDKTSYSIPEDGRSLTIPTKKIRTDKSTVSGSQSQTSLLIEYYEAGKGHDSGTQRPSVRVKVTPHARKTGKAGDVKITEYGKDRKPSYTRRISLGSKQDSRGFTADLSQPQVQVDLMANKSEMSNDPAMGNTYVPPPSDISSMPPDSTLDGPPIIKTPQRRRSRSLERIDAQQLENASTNLKAPDIGRSRSLSKERITRKALEKIARDASPEETTASRVRIHHKTRPSSGSIDQEDVKAARSRKSSRSHRDSDLRSGTDSSLLPPRDIDSNISSTSKVSLNNPKLLQTVEDAIRRLILPEIETLKRNQSIRSTRTRDSYASESSAAYHDRSSRHSKSSSRHEAAIAREDEDRGGLLEESSHRRRKHRHSSSRDTPSDKSSSRRDSLDSIGREKERIRKSKDSKRTRDVAETGLTKAALRSHNSRSSVDSYDRELREKRKHRTSKSRSATESVTNTETDLNGRKGVPPLPMNSEIQDSELTRESILSAETAETDDAPSEKTHKDVPAVREVARGSPREVLSPVSRTSARTPVDTQRTLRSQASDRSVSSKSRTAALAAAGLGGAAAAMYGLDSKRETGKRTSSREEKHSTSRPRSPAVASADVRGEDKQSARDITNVQEDNQLSKATPSAKVMSQESLQSTSTREYPITSKRHPTVNLENEPDLVEHVAGEDDDYAMKAEDEDQFYERQHKLNDEYRSSAEYESYRDSFNQDSLRDSREVARDSLDAPSFGKAAAGQQLRGLGANPELVHTSLQPESAVASLVNQSFADDSKLSPQSSEFDDHPDLSHKPDIEHLDQTREMQQDSPSRAKHGVWQSEEASASADRWTRIRGHAQKLSNGSISTQGSGNHGSNVQGGVRSMKSGDSSPSVVEGRLGTPSGWPYEPTPPVSDRRAGIVDTQDRYHIGSGGAALMGAAAGLGIAGAAGAHQRAQSSNASLQQRPGSFDSRSDDQSLHRETMEPTPNKDEGYVSSAPQTKDVSVQPLSFSGPPPKLFDDKDTRYDPNAVDEDPFGGDARARHLSVNSHGIPAEGYDAATGTGINNIDSKDIVALMDHLTVRDGHRNARDTEILVTLVRSAAEMRDNFDEMKKLINMQSQANMKRTDMAADKTANRVIGASRTQTSISPRPMRSLDASDKEDVPSKRRNIFKRAMRGLSSRNERDLDKIEDMLVRLLTEVEDLKNTQGGSQGVPTMRQDSINSYERLRNATESGYEPDGQAGTSSSRSIAAMSPQRSAQRMHSGYNANQRPQNQISTVLEGDEDDGFENDDGMKTPTQEAQYQKNAPFKTPPSASRGFQSYQNTPNTGGSGERSRQKSTGSSMFGGLPKVSRWSKTTTSSGQPERTSYQKDRPYSEASRSGSDVNVIPAHDDYILSEEDRFAGEEPGSREIHEYSGTPEEARISMEDPKYHANRHSLTLEHPQPRQGQTQRHQTHLESQADTFDGRGQRISFPPPHNANPPSPESPNRDAFGSVPSLARNRLSASQSHRRTLSPLSSDGGYGAPARPPKIRDDGPLVPPARPPKVPNSPEPPRRSMDTESADSYDSLEDARYRPTSYDAGRHGRDGQEDTWSAHSLGSEDRGDWIEPIPLERPRSPYSPGGLLAPIEERYSLEQSRISSPMSRRFSVTSRGTGLAEQDRSETPTGDAKPALGASDSPTMRKLTGPREMPASSRNGSGSNVLRKPLSARS